MPKYKETKIVVQLRRDPKASALTKRGDGKVSITLAKHSSCIIRIVDRDAAPYQPRTARSRAWGVVSLLDGLSVKQAHEILGVLELNIQGQKGRPLGWVVDAVDGGYASLETPK